MSLIICIHVEEGIVLASDSRVSYNKKIKDNDAEIELIGIHAANTANKTFSCPNNSGISMCGDASIKGKPISGFVEAFIREKVKEETKIEDMPNLIKDYFCNLEPNLDTVFIIAGYKQEKEKSIQKIYRIRTQVDEIEIIDTDSQGALWDGETVTLTKLIQPVYLKNGEEYNLLPVSEIPWNLYTLQDAIDFAKYGIKTTIDTMKFQTVPETVGGPIDILVIKPESAKWLAKKELKG